jgi:hypothetical protein
VSIRITALPNPFDAGKRIVRELDPGKSLRELYAGLDTGLDPSHGRFQVDGAVVTDFDYVPPDGAEVVIRVVPYGNSDTGALMKASGWLLSVAGVIVMGIAGWTGIGAAIGAGLVGAGISLMGNGTYMLLHEPQSLKNNTPETRPGIKGAGNQARPYGYVPVLLGRHLVTPDLAAAPYLSSVNNEQYLTQLFCCGYNNLHIECDSFKLGETKLIELSATKDIDQILAGGDSVIQMELLSGVQSSLYPRRVKPLDVSRELKETLDDGTSGAIVVTTPDNTSRIGVNLSFPNGLFGLDKDGDIITIGVYLDLWIKAAGNPDESAYTRFGYVVPGAGNLISAKSKKALYYEFSKEVEPGAWSIKIEKSGNYGGGKHRYDSGYVLTVNAFQDGPPVSLDCIQDLRLIALKVKATDRLNGVIDNFNFTAQAVLPVYSGEGSGPASWGTAALTKNPAAALLYVLRGGVNRRPVEDAFIDWRRLEDWYTWCEAHRYYCSAVLSDKITLIELLKQICLTGRAEPARRDGLFSVIQDVARGSHTQLLTPKNTVSYSQSLEFPDIPQAVEIQFIDEDSGFQEDVRKVYNTPSGEEENTDPSDFREMRPWGVTNARQAFLMGRYNYACLTNRPRVHTIVLDIEYLISYKGSWIKYSGDTALTGIAWGRLKDFVQTGSFITALTLDELIQMEAGKNYRIRIRTSKNQQAEYGVVYTPDYTNHVLLEDTIPVSFGAAAGDLYAFGEVGSVTLDLVIGDIDPVSDSQARLTCVDYAPEIFGIDDPSYIVPPWSPNVSVGGAADSGVPETPPPAYLNTIREKIVETQVETAERPTYTELVEGFTRAGMTIVPNQLTLSAAGGFRFIALSWAKQTSLSNLKEYQVQVSEDAVAWYAPRLDGVDWKGPPGGVFSTPAAMVVHPNIPPAGTPETPSGRFLYYRVRQRTMQDAYSNWSEAAGARTTVADTGDYGVNSISANALKVSELLAMFAKLSESLIVDPRFGLSSENAEWADGDTRALLNARQIAFQYFTDAVWTTMARFGLEGVEAMQIYSPDKLFITNADMRSRRSRGYDVGAPLPSGSSRTAHLDVYEELSVQGADTYILDQHGEPFLLLTGTGSLEGEAEGIPLILKAAAPYATETRALHGNFRLQGAFPVNDAWTLDFWFCYFWNESQVLFKVGGDSEFVQLSVQNAEPYLNDEPTDGVWLNDEPVDGVWLNEIKEAGTSVLHSFMGTADLIDLDPDELAAGKWYHAGLINNGSALKLLINNKTWTWASQPPPGSVAVDINPTVSGLDGEFSLFMIDEILFDPGTAENISLFLNNSILKRPWGNLDDQFPWAVINIKDPAYFRTNLFQGPDLAPAVLALFQKPDFAAAAAALLNGGTHG